MSSQVLKITPNDPLFFRDGKPFTWGEETFADGIFPPYPSVIYGAIRTAYAAQQGLAVEEIIPQSSNFRISALMMACEDGTIQGTFLPLPLDWVEPKGKDLAELASERKGKYTRFTPLVPYQGLAALAGAEAACSLANPKGLLFAPADLSQEVETVSEGLIPIRQFRDYLGAQLADEIRGRKISASLQEESKIGIGRENATRTAAKGKLYRVPLNRTLKFSFLVQLEGLDMSQHPKGVLKLGGEGKTAAYELISDPKEIRKSMGISFPGAGTADSNDSTSFKVYVSTPAFFDQGYPDLKKHLGIEAELQGQCVGKHLSIGGYDIEKNRPKAMRKAVPAGSIFVFEAQSPIHLSDPNLQGISLSDDRAEQGFGISYFAAI